MRFVFQNCKSLGCLELRLILLLALASVIVFLMGAASIRLAEKYFLEAEGTELTQQWGSLLAREVKNLSETGEQPLAQPDIIRHLNVASSFANIRHFRILDSAGAVILESPSVVGSEALPVQALKLPVDQATVLIKSGPGSAPGPLGLGYSPLTINGEQAFLEIQIDLSTLEGHASIIGIVSLGILAFVLVILTSIAGWLIHQYGVMRQARETALELARQAAEDSDRNKTNFLAGASHELRTPLNAIIGFTQMLDLPEVISMGEEKRAEYTKHVLDSAYHLLSLVNDLLDLSKISAGKIELDIKPIEIEKIIQHSVSLVSGQAEQAGVTIETIINHPSGKLLADERSLHQIMLNLLSNAVKFTPPNGHVKVTVSANVEGGLEIAVVDTGMGISKYNLGKVLEPFGQVDGELARQHKGTGLGLPMAKRLAELNGAAFHMESEIDIGTKIKLIFPPDRPHPRPRT